MANKTINIDSIIKNVEGCLSVKEGILLYKLAKKIPKDCSIVEIGSWKGKSTICMALGSYDGNLAKVYAIDPHNNNFNTYEEFIENIREFNVYDIITPIVSTSEKAACDFNKPIGLLFIDGAHDYENVKKDYELWFPKLINNGYIAFHDTIFHDGPKKFVDKYMLKSRFIKNVKFTDSIVYGKKVNTNTLIDRITNLFYIKYRKLYNYKLYLINPIIEFWKRYLTRKKIIKLNKLLYLLGLHGIGIKNFDKDMIITGENNFIKSHFRNNDKGIVFDVGAFVGNYSKKILDITENVEIYAFEPNPKNYEILINNINNKRFHPYNVAVGNDDNYIDLLDEKIEGTGLASIYKESIAGIYKVKPAVKHSVKMIKLDDFCITHKIDFIELLNIDVEGHKLEVLKGSINLLNHRKIKAIQFKFNDTHIYSRVFFKDFYDLLHKNYNLYRMLPDGLIPIATYNPIYCEIFAYQNIVAKLKA